MAAEPEFTIRQLRLFGSVTQLGSISAAADALAVPQPAVSRSIQRIEKVAGAELLTRSSRGVHLTAAGEAFLKNARRAVYYHDQAYAEAQELSGQLTGEVRIAAPESICGIMLADLVKTFQSAHPSAVIRGMVAASATIPTLLDSGQIDIGILADTHAAPPGHVEPLFREEFHLIGPGGAPELSKDTVRLTDAAKLPLILNAMAGGFRSVIDRGLDQGNLEANVYLEIDANGPLLDLLAAGEGYSIGPFSIVARKLGDLSLAAAKIVDPVLTRKLSIVLARGRPITPAMREVARLVRFIVEKHSAEARWLLD